MKKIVATFAFVLMIVYAGTSIVSAEAHEVEKGDSLWEIANQYDTTVDDLMDINELKTTVIHPKQELTIYETYKVKKGDTLSEIGKDLEVTVDNLKEWNELDSNLIVVGQELKVQSKNAIKSDEKEETSKSTEAKQEKSEPKQAKEEESKTETTQAKDEGKEANQSESKSDNSPTPEGKTVAVSATAYTAKCDGCSGVTASGVDLNANPNAKVIAVDPSVIPLGSEVYVEGYGYATAADTGGAIQGNKIDLHVPTKDEAYSWGVRTVKVTILD